MITVTPPILTPVVKVEIGGTEHVLYALQKKQLEAFSLTPLRRGSDGPRHIGYGGAAGGAKSHTARSIAAAVALSWPGSTTVIFRRTKPEVWNNHWIKFKQEVPNFGGQLYTSNASNMEITWFNGSRTLFGYLERDDHVFRYIGNEYDCMLFEEATQQSWFQVNWLVSNRLRASTSGTTPFAMYLTNPGGQGHFWFKRLFIDRKFEEKRGEKPELYTFVQAKVHDNAILMQRDPGYVARLEAQPEPYRSWYLEGDFSKGAGQALNMNYDQHMVEPFMIPPHWQVFRAFDWGFSHPFSLGLYTMNEEKRVFKIETITGRHLHDPEILDRLFETERSLDVLADHRRAHGGEVGAVYSHAGHDCWSDIRAKVENLPTTAETFAKAKVPLMRASISRIAGLKNMREYVNYDAEKGMRARFQLLITDNNERCFEQLGTMVSDPDNLEDALKMDADEYGEGGDDMYDECRYGLASQPLKPRAQQEQKPAAPEHYDDKLEKLAKELDRTRRRKGKGRTPLS